MMRGIHGQNETNLTLIKEYLKEWIWLPCEPDKEFNGLFNNHPIIEVATMIEGKLVNVDEKTIDKVREQYIEQIEMSEDVYRLFMLLKKPYRLTLFQVVHENLSEKDFNDILSWVYKDIEFPNHNNDVESLVNIFKNINPKLFMDEEDKRMYDSLPNQIEVYRGMYCEQYYDAVSWTTDVDVAKWFANRFTQGYVATAIINKADVFCCYRSEQEVVVNPYKVLLKEIVPSNQTLNNEMEVQNQMKL